MLSLLLLTNAASAFYILSTKTLLSARMDSIVNPGGVSKHLHDIAGGNAFKATYDYEDSLTADCTTMPVTVDKSNYWAPAAYYHDKDTGDFHKLKGGFNVYYLFRNGSKKSPIKAWPKGLRMLAGDPGKNTYNSTNHADQAVSYVCLDYRSGSPNGYEGPTWPKTDCPNGVRIQIFFPSCWDGVNYDSADHKSHMAYPIDNYNGGNCPDSHPVQLISLFYEHIVDTTPYKYYGEGSFVLSTGDKIGYSNHGDFTNGWEDLELLQKSVDTCDDMYGVLSNCNVLKPYIDDEAASACQPKTDAPMEDVGLWNAIKALPGDNLLWGPEAKQAAANPPATPNFGPIEVAGSINGAAQFANYNGNSSGGKTSAAATSTKKPSSSTSTKAVTKTSSASTKVTKTTSVKSTQTKTTSVKHTSTKTTSVKPTKTTSVKASSTKKVTKTTSASATSTAPVSHCSAPAKRSDFHVHRRGSMHSEDITFPRRFALLSGYDSTVSANTDGLLLRKRAVASSVIPSAWKALGCYQDVGGRLLKDASTTDKTQELGTCIAFCESKGFKVAGAEYANECYCSSSLPSSAVKVDDAECTTTCAGNAYQQCGGGQRLTIYQKA
ncbi:WSC-domain-containing protein [Atractiella rhizophila]|nr:WSC-domain-containing protein [Atractiella rhizophila]